MVKRYDYFIGSMKSKTHYYREWMLRAFTVVISPPADSPWMLRHTDKAVEVYVPNEGGYAWEVLEDTRPYEIPFIYHDWSGPVKAGDVENLKKDLPNATWGDLLFNSRVLVYGCGDIIEYMEGPIDSGPLMDVFIKRMKSDPKSGEADIPGELYVKHWMKVGKAIGDIAGYELFVPSVTEKSLQPPPNRDELRAKLVKENEGNLDDPVIQTKIQDELVKSYKDYIKGDPSEGFLYKRKSFNTALKRMFLIHGPEAGFDEGGRAKLVLNSLQEGLDMTQYPAMVNSLRAGSYYRGALTALAGTDVDLMGRIFQNARILPDFCGTKEFAEIQVTEGYVGRYIDIKGKRIEITLENLPEYKNTVQSMYSPQYCKADHNDCCSICIGSKLAAFPNSLGSMVANTQSIMMYIMMGSAHAKELKTTEVDISNFLR